MYNVVYIIDIRYLSILSYLVRLGDVNVDQSVAWSIEVRLHREHSTLVTDELCLNRIVENESLSWYRVVIAYVPRGIKVVNKFLHWENPCRNDAMIDHTLYPAHTNGYQ